MFSLFDVITGVPSSPPSSEGNRKERAFGRMSLLLLATVVFLPLFTASLELLKFTYV